MHTMQCTDVNYSYTPIAAVLQVGSYLKVPQCPIWVVGSSSHFSVLFSLHR